MAGILVSYGFKNILTENMDCKLLILNRKKM